MATKTQLTGGAFQDAEGNVLALGWLIMKLNQDGVVTGSGQIASGIDIRIELDSSGNVSTSPAQLVWANDDIFPVNSYYRVTGYKANGQPAWGPNNQQVISGATFDVGTWVPNEVFSWTPATTGVLLEVEDVANTIQNILNLKSEDSSVTITDEGDGSVDFAVVTGGSADEIQSVPVSATAPQIGDTFRYNEYGDSKWDIVTGRVPFFQAITPDIFAASTNCLPNPTPTSTNTGTIANVAGTATESPMLSATSAAVGSTSIVAGFQWTYTGGVVGHYPIGCTRRFSTRLITKNSSNVRYWIGVSDRIGGNVLGTGWASDTPNGNYAAFRFSTGTDTTIKAVCGTSNVLQTVVDTGVSISTTVSKMFEIVYDGTGFFFYIDGVQVAHILTNVMANTTLVGMNAVADNKNTATAVALNFGWMETTFK